MSATTTTTNGGVPTRLNGAQARGTEWCWATRRDGSVCGAAASSCVPYCAKHLERGDEAFRVVTHPTFGDKILIATRDLPRGYKTVYFGERKSWRECGRRGRDHAMHFKSGGGVIDPTPLGASAQLQFMSNPGPNEVSNNRSTNVFFGDTRAPKGSIVGREFTLCRDVKAGSQLTQWYGADWFRSRDIARVDVGVPKYPVERKKNAPPLVKAARRKRRDDAKDKAAPSKRVKSGPPSKDTDRRAPLSEATNDARAPRAR
jgi:hypothetical protein